jgi:predicted GIY-YIG superfamily endonuclease
MSAEIFTLYRFFDAQDRLLYVGITGDVTKRWRDHHRQKPWMKDVARATLTHYGSREELAVAEVQAIQTERPVHNVVHAVRVIEDKPAGRVRWPRHPVTGETAKEFKKRQFRELRGLNKIPLHLMTDQDRARLGEVLDAIGTAEHQDRWEALVSQALEETEGAAIGA